MSTLVGPFGIEADDARQLQEEGERSEMLLMHAAHDLRDALQAIMDAHGPGTLASHEIYLNACNALAKAEGREPVQFAAEDDHL